MIRTKRKRNEIETKREVKQRVLQLPIVAPIASRVVQVERVEEAYQYNSGDTNLGLISEIPQPNNTVNAIITYTYETSRLTDDINIYLRSIKPLVINRMRIALSTGSKKINFHTIGIMVDGNNNNHDMTLGLDYRRGRRILTQQNHIELLWQFFVAQIRHSLSNRTGTSRDGKRLVSIDHSRLYIFRYNNRIGARRFGSSSSYIKTPEVLIGKTHSITNIENLHDRECFKWSIVYLMLFHKGIIKSNKTRVSNYKEHCERLIDTGELVLCEGYDKTKVTGFPVDGPLMDRFERDSNLSIAIWKLSPNSKMITKEMKKVITKVDEKTGKKKKVLEKHTVRVPIVELEPIRRPSKYILNEDSTINKARNPNLLYVPSSNNPLVGHYIAITDLKSLFNRGRGKGFWCRVCESRKFKYVWEYEEHVKSHRNDIEMNQITGKPMIKKLPKKDTVCKYYAGIENRHEDIMPYFAVIDFEALLLNPLRQADIGPILRKSNSIISKIRGTRVWIKILRHITSFLKTNNKIAYPHGEILKETTTFSNFKEQVINTYNQGAVSKILSIIADYADLRLTSSNNAYQCHEAVSYVAAIINSQDDRICNWVNYRAKSSKDKAVYVHALEWLRDRSIEYKKNLDPKWKKRYRLHVYARNMKGYDMHMLLAGMSQVKWERNVIDPKTKDKKYKKWLKIVDTRLPQILGKSLEKISSCKINYLWLKDSMSLIPGSLESRVSVMHKEVKNMDDIESVKNVFGLTFKFFERWFSHLPPETIVEMTKKGEYWYDYMSHYSKMEEKEIPHDKWFNSPLKEYNSYKYGYISANTITQIDTLWILMTEEERNKARCRRGRARYMYDILGCKNLGEYTDYYNIIDVVLEAQVIQNYRKMKYKQDGLDAVQYISAPGLSWAAGLKYTGVEFPLFTDKQIDMLTLVQSCIRGGISMGPYHRGEANNPYMKNYDKDKPTTWIISEDVNGLYAGCMREAVPIGGFRFCTPDEYDHTLQFLLEQARDIDDGTKDHFDENGIRGGGFVSVDLEYPDELHDLHNDYPCAPQRMEVPLDWVSEWTKTKISRYGLTADDVGFTSKNEKLICTLFPKERFCCHYRELYRYYQLGLRVTKKHQILLFKEKECIRPYVERNAKLRKEAKTKTEELDNKQASNDFYGKTSENPEKHQRIHISTSENQTEKLISDDFFKHAVSIKGGVSLISMHKNMVKLDKPIYIAAAILGLSKSVMYGIHYNYFKATYGKRIRLLMTDTDSLVYMIETENVYRDLATKLKHILDCSVYCRSNDDKKTDVRLPLDLLNSKKPEDIEIVNMLQDATNQRVLLKLKDVAADDKVGMLVRMIIMAPKLYAQESENGKSKIALKGLNKETQKHISYEAFNKAANPTSTITTKEALKGNAIFIDYNKIESSDNNLTTNRNARICARMADNKFHHLSETETLAHGHYLLKEKGLYNKKKT